MAAALHFAPEYRAARLPSPPAARFSLPPSPLAASTVYNTPNRYPPPSPPHLLQPPLRQQHPHPFYPQPSPQPSAVVQSPHINFDSPAPQSAPFAQTPKLFTPTQQPERPPPQNTRYVTDQLDTPLPPPHFIPHHSVQTAPHPLDPYGDPFLLSDSPYCANVSAPPQHHEQRTHPIPQSYYDASIAPLPQPHPPLIDLPVQTILPPSSFTDQQHTVRMEDKLTAPTVQKMGPSQIGPQGSHSEHAQMTTAQVQHSRPKQQMQSLQPPPTQHVSAQTPHNDIRERRLRGAKQQSFHQHHPVLSLPLAQQHNAAQGPSSHLRLSHQRTKHPRQQQQQNQLPPLQTTPPQDSSMSHQQAQSQNQKVRHGKHQSHQHELLSAPLPQQSALDVTQQQQNQILPLPASQMHASVQLPDAALAVQEMGHTKQVHQLQLPPLPPQQQRLPPQAAVSNIRQQHVLQPKQLHQHQPHQLPPLPPTQQRNLHHSHLQDPLAFAGSIPDSVMIEDATARQSAFLAASLTPGTALESEQQNIVLQQYVGSNAFSIQHSTAQGAFLSQGALQPHQMQQELLPGSDIAVQGPPGFSGNQNHGGLAVQCELSQERGTTSLSYVAVPHQQATTLLLAPPLQTQLEQGLPHPIGPSPDLSIHPLVQPVVSAANAFGVPDLLAGAQFTIRPEMLDQYMAVGNACRDIGRFDLAASTFRACMTICPDSNEARAAYGSCFYGQSFYDPSLEVGTVFPEDVFNDVGNSLRSIGRAGEAECAYRAALSIAPRHAHAWNNLGNAMRAKGQIMEAMQCYTSSLNSQPGFAAAHCNLAGLLRDQGKPQEAETQYRAALMTDPNLPEAAAGLGTALRDMGRTEEAVPFYVRAVSLQPHAADHHANLANTYKDLNRIEESIMSYQAALSRQPDLPDAFCNMVHSLSVICDWRNREQNFATLLAIIDRQLDTLLHHPATNPRLYNTLVGALSNSTPQLVDVCGGSRSERDGASVSATTSREENSMDKVPRRKFIHHPSSPTIVKKARMRGKSAEFLTSSPAVVAPVLASGLPSVQPFHALIYPMSPEKFRALSAAYATRAESMVAGIPLARQRVTRPCGNPRPRLKVGYVSSDYNNHPYSHLTQSVYGLHGTGGTVECYCYALTPSDQSSWRLRIEREAEHFRDISGMTAKQSAETIANDGIHVLVNCNGYTKGARTELFALRPAPVQVSFMGFPGTLGAHYIEYFITDVVTSPPEMASRMHSEALLYHPHSYFVNDHRQTSIPGPAAHPSGCLTRAHYGLPENCFLFMMHNQLYKLSPDTFDVWARILNRVPGSKLWLLRFPPTGEQRIRNEAAARGLSADRLIFTDVAGKEEHVARAGLGDLFLDTPTCNAHTTGTDVLWSGVPMVTCPGSLFASRVAASLLTAAGVPELIAADMNEYEDLAVELATNRPKLQAVRTKLESSRNSNALFDTERWVRNVEALYWAAWNNYESGNQPTHIFGKDVYDGSTMVSRPTAVESHYSTTESRRSETLIQNYGRLYNSSIAT